MSKDVPRGPARWERARRIAERNPNSSHAALYRSRIAVAEKAQEALELLGVPDSPFDWMKFNWAMRQQNPMPKVVEFRTCSVFCTAMHANLEMKRGQDIPQIITDVLDGIPWEPTIAGIKYMRLRTHEPTEHMRAARCMVCGATIHTDGSVKNKNQPKAPKVKPAAQSELQLELETARSLNDELRKALDQARRDLSGSLQRQGELARDRDRWKSLVDEATRRSDHMIDTESLKDLFYLTPDGYFLSVLDIPVVQFDDADRLQLLQDYGTAETRRNYVNDWGGMLRGVF